MSIEALEVLGIVLMIIGFIIALVASNVFFEDENIVGYVITVTIIEVIAIYLARDPGLESSFIFVIVMTLAMYLPIIVASIIVLIEFYDDKDFVRESLLSIFLVAVSSAIIIAFGIVHFNNVDKDCFTQLENSENIIDFDVDGSDMEVTYYNKQGKKMTANLNIKTIETEDENLVGKYDFSSISKDGYVKYYKNNNTIKLVE